MLRSNGIALVAGMSMTVVVCVVAWRGWDSVPRALLEFSCAMLFTLVFGTLTVSSEKARDEMERLADELSKANQKLREYAAQIEELATTRERNRLAREIHDSLGHYLTVVNLQIEAARALRNSDSTRSWMVLDKAQALTQQGLQDIRRSVAALRASPRDDQPLEKALREIVDGVFAAGLTVEIEIRGEHRALSAQTRLTLYRAGQEGLTNVHKHARSTQARLELEFRQNDRVRLCVTDNGAGASDAVIAMGHGLIGLRERVQLLGGTIRVRTAPGLGFSLEVEVPG